MTTRLRSERGWAMVTAMLTLMIMMMIGLAALSFTDGQSRATGTERVQESSFNASEAALSAQSFVLASKWPGSADNPLPACTYANGVVTANGGVGGAAACPNAAALNGTLTSGDYANGNLTWTVEVHDNAGTEQCIATPSATCGYFWDEATSRSQPSYDANGDLEMWVRAQAVVRGQRRTVVGRVRVTKTNVQFPKNAVTAGSFTVSGGGPKGFVTLNGATMGLRCDRATNSTCLKLHSESNIVYPGTVESPYDDGGKVLRAAELDQLRQTAKANNTYYPAGQCPSSTAAYSGTVVFVENANCQLTGNGTINTLQKPGLIVFAAGTLKFTGTKTIYGTIYMANGQNSTAANLLDLGGNSTVVGSVMVDGNAGLSVTGSTKIVYDENAQQNFASITGAGLVRSSFRELDV